MATKTILLSLLLIATSRGFSQSHAELKKATKTHFGIKGGLNFSNVKDVGNFASCKSKEGFMLGGFMAAGSSKSGMGFRTELIFTRQYLIVQNGSAKPATINSDYISIPHLTTFSIAKIVQLQAGGQISILLNAKQNEGADAKSIADFYSKLKYGITGGIEVHPFKGLIVGGRYSVDVTNAYKTGSASAMAPYPFNLSTANLKGGLFQFSVGYIF
jgi:hypothetical protein